MVTTQNFKCILCHCVALCGQNNITSCIFYNLKIYTWRQKGSKTFEKSKTFWDEVALLSSTFLFSAICCELTHSTKGRQKSVA